MRSLILSLSGLLGVGAARATGPQNGQYGFQPAATSIAEDVHWVHNVILLPVIAIVTLVVLALLLWVIIRYNKRANPVPSTFTHNTTVEVIWTIIPVFVLVLIAAFTFPLLYEIDREPTIQAGTDLPIEADDWLSVKAQGNQWNWTYSFIDDIDEEGAPLVEYTSNPLQRGLSTDEVGDYALRNLQTDLPLVLPAGRYIRYYTAAADVIHSFAVPAFGFKTDAIPGRLNEGWFKVDEVGTYYGQCSELCGKDHAFMPIEIRVVEPEVFDAWYEQMKAGDYDAALQIVENAEEARATQLAGAAKTASQE